MTSARGRFRLTVARHGWLLGVFLCLAVAVAQPPAAPTTAANTWPAFPLEALAPGMRGTGLTEGPNGVERFDVEVIARQDGFGLGFPLVLVRASGGLVEAGGGVSAGMSGSPVLLSLDGVDHVLGAIGYVFPDAPGGLALVTPIEPMRAAAGTTASDGDGGLADRVATAADRLGAVPVATPLLVTGLGARASALLATEVWRDATVPVQVVRGGGAGASSAAPPAAGSAIAVQWVRGDVDIGAVGTVTEIDGTRLLAFGHPVLGRGPVDWPLAGARVTAVVPHASVPFKLANTASGTLGAVTADRAAAVVGRLGTTADLLPVTLTVAYGDADTALGFEVVRDEALWPTLVAVASLEALDRVRDRSDAGTATVYWDVAFEVGPPLRLSETVVDEADVVTAAARLAGAPLRLLAENPFEATRIERLSLLVRLDDRRRDVEVRRATVDPGPVEAGAVLPVYLHLQPWRRGGEVRTIDVRLPTDVTGRVELVVRGGTEPRDPDEPETPAPEDRPLTYDELIAFLRERPGGADLVIDARTEDGRWLRLDRRPLDGFVTGRVTLVLDVQPATDGADTGPDPSDPEEDP